MKKDATIYVAGHTGLVGSAILRKLQAAGHTRLLTRSHQELDLTERAPVEQFFQAEAPEYVFLAAARVGGIQANDAYPAEFVYQNLAIQTNVIDLAYRHGVKKLLFPGSSCIYPKTCRQPMKEEDLLTGRIEPTNQPYAVAKLAGLEMVRAYNRQYGTHFITPIPANVYGVNDHFGADSHVVAALIQKFHRAKIQAETTVTIWGTGRPRREFFYVDDLADACLFLMENYDRNEVINVGTGRDTSVAELVDRIVDLVGYPGEVVYDTTKPDGNPQRLLDISRMSALGWQARTSLEEGLRRTYEWYKEAVAETG